MKPGLFAAAVIATFVVGFAVGRVSAPVPPSPSPPLGTGGPVFVPPSGVPPLGGPSPAAGRLEGTVAEVIQVPNYTYLRLQTASGDTWAAVSTTESVRQGQQVRLATATEMTGFTSKTLGRTFDSIWFGELEGAMGAAPRGTPEGLPPGHPPMGAPAPVTSAAGALAAVEQAGTALSLRVVDVFTERAALNGKKVRVVGQAAKVTAVQGAFYVHLKDGSGTAGKDDDLTVITSTEVKADAKVTVEGRVALDKDVGMGTPYPVVVENATVVGN